MSYESEKWYNLEINIKNLKAWFGLKFGLYIDHISTLSTWYIKGSANFRRKFPVKNLKVWFLGRVPVLKPLVKNFRDDSIGPLSTSG